MILKYILCASAVYLGVSNTAMSESLDIKDTEVRTTGSESVVIDNNFIEAWGIDADEYKHYLHLKNNTPRGYYTPGNNPLYILALEADTIQEQRRYARLLAKLEFENVQKIQKLNKLIQQESIALYGRGQIANYQMGQEFADLLASSSKDAILRKVTDKSGFKDVAKVRKIYITDDCKPCDRLYEKGLAALMKNEVQQLQVIFPVEDDEMIVKWAIRNEVPRDLNNNEFILLRGLHDDESIAKWPTELTHARFE